jgi:hypothetical protein
VFGDVAVRQPQARVADVEQDVHVWPVRMSTVSFHTRFGSTVPSRARTRNRPAPWRWKG